MFIKNCIKWIQTITGRLWFENKHMLFVSSNTCNAEIFAVNVISIKDADI